jgi:hypothetical protein
MTTAIEWDNPAYWQRELKLKPIDAEWLVSVIRAERELAREQGYAEGRLAVLDVLHRYAKNSNDGQLRTLIEEAQKALAAADPRVQTVENPELFK